MNRVIVQSFFFDQTHIRMVKFFAWSSLIFFEISVVSVINIADNIMVIFMLYVPVTVHRE